MNETENKNEPTTEQTSETTTETVPEKELSPEEKLAERERVLAEREKAFELKPPKSTAEESLKSKGIPTELADFLNYESAETMNTGIEKLAEILKNFEKPNLTGMTACLGQSHGTALSGGGRDDFLKEFCV